MTPREELAQTIVDADGWNRLSSEDAAEIADAVLAAGYRKVEAGRDARETASEVFAEICAGNCIQEPCLIAPCHCRNAIATAITAAVEAQRERWWELVLWLNGERGDFPERQDGQGIYYWRREMMKRAAAIREG